MTSVTDGIHSFNPLADLSPRMVAQFFAANNWYLEHESSGIGQVWANNDLEAQIMLPLDRELRDFERRFTETLNGIGDILHLQGEPLALEIVGASNDILLLRADQFARNGSIPLAEAKKLIDGSSIMLESAACSAIRPRPSIRGRRPQRVAEFISDEVRMGHTMRGSFVLTILAEIDTTRDIGEHNPNESDTAPSGVVPFSRRAFSTLAAGLRAAQEISIPGSDFPLEDAVESGVTAELLQTLEEMGEFEGLRSLDARFKWASVADIENPVPGVSRTQISKESLSNFDSYISALRGKNQESPRQIVGYIRRLERGPDDDDGVVVVEGNFDLKSITSRTLRVSLAGEQYSQAIRVHEAQSPIVVEGHFVRRGRSFWAEGEVSIREI